MTDSDSDEENLVQYGTPLDPYDEDEIPSKRKYQKPVDQYAVDEHGRRRFHGAFTGGFSAGFGNTVGTAEGWTPQSFKSSRMEKAAGVSQRPEDFMDEEDRSEFGIAPRQLRPNADFSGQKRQRPTQYHDGPIPGEPVLDQFLRCVPDTAAVRMLKAMGWKPGQGAGERRTAKEKRQANAEHRVYSCYVPEEFRQAQTEQSDSDSDLDLETLFAPDDYEPYILAPKSDRFGLDYSGLSRHSVLGSDDQEISHLKMKDQGKRVSIRGQAFGVGAFEAEDEDIYATEDMSRYDFILGGPSKEDKKKIAPRQANVLEGFVRATAPPPAPASYPPPALPRDYIPAAAGARRSRFEPTQAPQRDQGLGRHELTPEARGALLGEIPIQKPAVTPIQNLPYIQKQPPIQIDDPIAKIVGRNVNFVTTKTNEVQDCMEKSMDFISIADSGKEVAKVFKPFLGNPKKQARYERYVSDRESFMREEDSNMDRLAEWERERELIEFEQAAKLYRPLTGDMGDRFTHASQPDDAINPLTAVARSSTSYGLATPEQIKAAEMNAYGVITRNVVQWRPDSLVCKRFNVPVPGAARDEHKDDKPKVSYSIFSYLESSVHDKESFAKEQSKFSGSKSVSTQSHKETKSHTMLDFSCDKRETFDRENVASTSENSGFTKRMTAAELFMKEAEKDMKDKEKGIEVAETIEKFDKMELYKSIFLSDSEEEAVEEPKVIDFDAIIDGPKNVERNTSPPRGIFANIDFDELNSWKRNADDKRPNKPTDDNVNDKIPNQLPPKELDKDKNIQNAQEQTGQPTNQSEPDIYGPKIPENLQKRLQSSESERDNFKPVFRSRTEKETVVEIDSSSSSDSWVDMEQVKSKNKKKEKKKKSKKHKKDKHKKSKHKKKDR